MPKVVKWAFMVGKQFRMHRTVAHATMLSGPSGENNNQAEELNARFDRAEKGISTLSLNTCAITQLKSPFGLTSEECQLVNN